MTKILKILQSEYSSEYSNPCFVKNYTNPKLYPKIITTKPVNAFSKNEKNEIMAKYKRWYIYYSFVNEDGQMKRQGAIYFNINRNYPDFDDRLKHIKMLRQYIESLLKNGFSPYESEIDPKLYTTESTLDFALSIKKNSITKTSYTDYKTRLNQFKKFLTQKGLIKTDIVGIDKKVVNEFLNHTLIKSSPRNRNNTKSVLSAVFTVLEDNDLIPRNFIKNIKNLKANPKRNKAYTIDEVNNIFKFLEETDTNLLLFIKFVSYNFLRPVEVCRLKVSDIDLKNKQLQVRAKNKLVKIKIIPDIMMNELLKLDLNNLDDFIITPYGVGEWKASEENKRGYFGKKYLKVKNILNITKEYTIYSFRHTYITKIYRELRQNYSKTETYDELMLITGHSTMTALQKYLRDIDAELPQDYSKYLK